MQNNVHTHYSLELGRHRPITDREMIPSCCYHAGKRMGDIVIGDTGIPLVVWSYNKLDDGSGAGSFVFFDKPYRVIGSIYEAGDIEKLLPFLCSRGRTINYEKYGLIPPE